MKRTIAAAIALALLPLGAATAQPSRPAPPGLDRPAPPGRPAPDEPEEPRGRRAAMREDVQKRLRLYRTVELAQALELSDAEALKLSAEMQRFDDRRAPLRATLEDARRTARKAAKGEAAALAGLDPAIAGATRARKQLADLDLEEFQALQKLVPPERRGKLALFLLQYPQRLQKLVREARHGEEE